MSSQKLDAAGTEASCRRRFFQGGGFPAGAKSEPPPRRGVPSGDVLQCMNLAVVDVDILNSSASSLAFLPQIRLDDGGIGFDVGRLPLAMTLPVQHADASQIPMTRFMSCPMSRMAISKVSDAADVLHQLRRLGRVHARRRLVQQQAMARRPAPGRSPDGAVRRWAGSPPVHEPDPPCRRSPTSPAPKPRLTLRLASRNRGVTAGQQVLLTLFCASPPSSRFSMTLISLYSRIFWKVRAMPLCG